jgi:hypothetical protein
MEETVSYFEGEKSTNYDARKMCNNIELSFSIMEQTSLLFQRNFNRYRAAFVDGSVDLHGTKE